MSMGLLTRTRLCLPHRHSRHGLWSTAVVLVVFATTGSLQADPVVIADTYPMPSRGITGLNVLIVAELEIADRFTSPANARVTRVEASVYRRAPTPTMAIMMSLRED